MRSLLRGVFCGVVLCVLLGSEVGAQRPTSVLAPLSRLVDGPLTARSSAENSAVALNLLRPRVRLTAVRPFGPDETALLDSLVEGTSAGENDRFTWMNPWAAIFANTREPNLQTDGPIWQGRGLTAAAGGGVTWKLGPVRGSLQPMAFASQNLPYSPVTGDSTIVGQFGYPVHGGGMDMPYRFGADMYGRIDPGESWIRADVSSFGIGLTTASQHWGPAVQYPLVMGASAPGYARVFLECFCRVPGFAAKAHWSVGRLESSGYEATSSSDRTAAAFVFALSPDFLPGLEVGASRFFHVLSDSVGAWDTAVLPFAGFVKRGDPTGEDETGQQNQLLSVFARIAPAGARAEFYGEYLREDHNSDWRDFAVEPDHVSAFTFGFRRVFQAADSSFGVITVEAANARISHLNRLRSQSPMYRHSHVRQGHTHRGQPLGAYQIPGGGGVAFRYDAVRWKESHFALFEIRRTVQTDEGGTWGDRNLAAALLTVGRAHRVRGLEIEWSAGAQHHLQTRTFGNLTLAVSILRLGAAAADVDRTSSSSDSR